MSLTALDPTVLLRPRRSIVGASAILLPFDAAGAIDWLGFEAHLARTFQAGLIPAVNMDTGYVNLIDHATQDEVLQRSEALAGGQPFFAGAFVGDRPGDRLDRDAYLSRIDAITRRGGDAGHLPVARSDQPARR